MLTGSVSSAAKLLHVSQPAISQVLRHLEDQLHFALFERIKGRLRPTEDAQTLYVEVARLYEDIQRIKDLADNLRARRHGLLRIVCSPSLVHVVMPKALAVFRKRHPEISIAFEALSFRPIVDRVVLNQADLGIAMCPEDEPALNSEKLCTAELVCALPIGHPLAAKEAVTPADLQAHPLISFDSDNAIGRLVEEAFQTAHEPRQVAIKVRFGETAQELVRNNLGVAVVDSLTVGGMSPGELVVRDFLPKTTLTVAMITPAFRPISPIAGLFADVLRQTVRELGSACQPINPA